MKRAPHLLPGADPGIEQEILKLTPKGQLAIACAEIKRLEKAHARVCDSRRAWMELTIALRQEIKRLKAALYP